jgi:pSer/pThr/pTyr-binding forkhead associated (FHA) protein
MAFVVVLFRGEEVTRRELNDDPLIIGRSPECDISVRDIILSRRHCKLVPTEQGWAVEDLGSKNGTHIGGEMVQWSLLANGTAIRIGKTQLRFYTGSLKSAPPPRKAPLQRKRPVDPFEALSGTVAAFEFQSNQPKRDISRLPTPLPTPSDPKSYSNEDVYTMLTEIASSSWDSIYATASGPAAVLVAGQKQRPLPNPVAKVAGADMPPRRRNVVTDPSLQAVHDGPEQPSSSIDLSPMNAPMRAMGIPGQSRRNWFRPMGTVLRGMKHVLTGKFLRRSN